MQQVDNRSENAWFKYIVKDLDLSVKQADQLHRAISKKGYSKVEIIQIAQGIKG